MTAAEAIRAIDARYLAAKAAKAAKPKLPSSPSKFLVNLQVNEL